MEGYKLFWKGLAWEIGDRERIQFWFDDWLGEGPSMDLCPPDISVDVLRITLAHYSVLQ